MAKPKKSVLARGGNWSHEAKNGQLTEVRGFFELDDEFGARGTAKFLRKSGICESARYERVSGGYEIVMTAETANLKKFEKFCDKHRLMPAWEKERADAEHAQMLADLDEEKRREPRFTPVKGEEARKSVLALSWQVIEAPPHGTSSGDCYVGTTTNPELAFRAAHYLERKDIIGKKVLQQLVIDINDAIDGHIPGMEYRIAVDGKKAEKLLERFPGLGSGGPPPGWSERIDKEGDRRRA